MQCTICSNNSEQGQEQGLKMIQTKRENCFICPRCYAITFISKISKTLVSLGAIQ